MSLLRKTGLYCLFRSRHEPRRHPLGGFRCQDCQATGLSFDDLGFETGLVRPNRPTFRRPGWCEPRVERQSRAGGAQTSTKERGWW